jgi:hypothetical protein
MGLVVATGYQTLKSTDGAGNPYWSPTADHMRACPYYCEQIWRFGSIIFAQGSLHGTDSLPSVRQTESANAQLLLELRPAIG